MFDQEKIIRDGEKENHHHRSSKLEINQLSQMPVELTELTNREAQKISGGRARRPSRPSRPRWIAPYAPSQSPL